VLDERYKIVAEKRATNSAELSDMLSDDTLEDKSLAASCLRVYDVEKLADDVSSVPVSVSQILLKVIFIHLVAFEVN